MLKIIIFALITLGAVLVLNKTNGEYAMLTSFAAGGLIFLSVCAAVYPYLSELFENVENYGADASLIKYVIKVFAICYITKFASEICNDFGQTSLAGKVDLAGRSTVFIHTIPLLKGVLEIASALM